MYTIVVVHVRDSVDRCCTHTWTHLVIVELGGEVGGVVEEVGGGELSRTADGRVPDRRRGEGFEEPVAAGERLSRERRDW